MKPDRSIRRTVLTGLILTIPFVVISCSRCSLDGTGLGRGGPKIITVLTYNAENIFDDVDNGSEYRDYDPGQGTWTSELYHSRLRNLADALLAVPPKGPDVAALQEIENLKVLEDLRDLYLTNSGLKFILCPEAPGSAVNTALLSRYPITETRAHRITTEGSENLRYVLEAHIKIDDSTLVVLNNHWKSKSGGAEATEPLRVLASKLVARRVEELAAEDPACDVLVLGDFNVNHDEHVRIAGSYPTALMPRDNAGENSGGGVVCVTEEPSHASIGDNLVCLYTVWAGIEAPGSYAYKGQWERIDNILCSPGIFDGMGLVFAEARLLDAAFLLDSKGYPLSWKRDLQIGYSDHLPLFISLEVYTRK